MAQRLKSECAETVGCDEEWTVTEQPPLVVDLDGSLLRVDTLHESIVRQFRSPQTIWTAFRAGLRGGKAALKAAFESGAPVETELLPVNVAVLDYVTAEASSGRDVYLASGANSHLANTVAERFGVFREVFSSDGVTNLTSRSKATFLSQRFGKGGFDYIGNSAADLAVWSVARNAVFAGVGRPQGRLKSVGFSNELIDQRPSMRTLWFKQIRLHQSAKNILLFLPLLAAHEFLNPSLLGRAVIGFFAFTMMASAVYLLNDALDLDVDRAHSRKRNRPMAAGWISPLIALSVGVGLSVGGFVLAALLGWGFFFVVLIYALLTLSYSWTLKRITLIDVITLALLYMIRIFAGAVATSIELSFWFTGVTLFLFLSLAFVKRYSEIRTHSGDTKIPGRGYRASDQGVVLALGVSSGIAAILLLAVYIQSNAVALLYPAAPLLWLSIPAVFYWFSYVWMTASRGEMHEDPVVFALRDRTSLIAAGVVAALFIAATLPQFEVLLQIFTQ